MHEELKDTIARLFDVPRRFLDRPCAGARVWVPEDPVIRSWPPGTPTGNLTRLDALHMRADIGMEWLASDIRAVRSASVLY